MGLLFLSPSAIVISPDKPQQQQQHHRTTTTRRTGPNPNLCTNDCKPGTCDDQGFCIDSGCGSVIYKNCKKSTRKEKTHGTHPGNYPTYPTYPTYPQYPYPPMIPGGYPGYPGGPPMIPDQSEIGEPIGPGGPMPDDQGGAGPLGPPADIQGPHMPSTIPGGPPIDNSTPNYPDMPDNTDQSQLPDDQSSQEQPFPIKGSVAPDQLQVGGDPQGIWVNDVTNKIYILNSGNGTVTVLDSKSGTVKNIHVGFGESVKNIPVGFGESCYSCIGGDWKDNKIYVANALSDTVSVIDVNSDTVKKTIPVGRNPTFVLAPYPNKIEPTPFPAGVERCCKIYVANTQNDTVSVIDVNSDTVKKTIPVGWNPTFILAGPPGRQIGNEIYVATIDNVSVIGDSDDTVKKTIALPPPPKLNFPGILAYTSPPHMYMQEIWNLGSAYKIDVLRPTMIINKGEFTVIFEAYSIQPFMSDIFFPHTTLNVTVKQIQPFMSAALPPPYYGPRTEVRDEYFPGPIKNYILNHDNGTASVDSWPSYQKHIVIGRHPGPIAINRATHILYIGYPESGTVSVINGFALIR